VEAARGDERSWLHENRLKIALGIAGVEAFLAVFGASLSRWSILVLAVVAVAVWYWVGRDAPQESLRDVSWIAAVSQALALIAVVVASFIGVLALVVAALFAVVALLLIIGDRRQ
jgi:hypothetical protein